jgi:hypothetical protein
MIRYAWAADWPVKGTMALTMDEVLENAFEFGITYQLTKEGEPLWENLWIFMARAIVADGIILPANVSRERLDYLASCEKVNQSVHVTWREKSQDGSTQRVPEDHGCGVEGIIRTNNNNTLIIIRHLLGLAPAGYLAAPDNGA